MECRMKLIVSIFLIISCTPAQGQDIVEDVVISVKIEDSSKMNFTNVVIEDVLSSVCQQSSISFLKEEVNSENEYIQGSKCVLYRYHFDPMGIESYSMIVIQDSLCEVVRTNSKNAGLVVYSADFNRLMFDFFNKSSDSWVISSLIDGDILDSETLYCHNDLLVIVIDGYIRAMVISSGPTGTYGIERTLIEANLLEFAEAYQKGVALSLWQ